MRSVPSRRRSRQHRRGQRRRGSRRRSRRRRKQRPRPRRSRWRRTREKGRRCSLPRRREARSPCRAGQEEADGGGREKKAGDARCPEGGRQEIRAEQAKKKQMEEDERKRQEMLAAQKEGGKKSSGPAMDARKEMSKSKEQVEEEMKISLSI